MASGSSELFPGSAHENNVAEWVLAREGINLIVNDKVAEAKKLFSDYPDSVVMFAGYAFALMMDALMSFEDDKLSKALLALKEVERRCATETGWLKTVTQRVFGTPPAKAPPKDYSEQLETQIILADSQVCIAILTFLQQDFSGYFKGGWALRKAWKIYQRIYKEILNLYKEHIGDLHLPTFEDQSLSVPDDTNQLSSSPSMEWDVPRETLTNGYKQNSSMSHSKSAYSQERLNSSENYSKSDYFLKSFPNVTTMRNSFSINSALSSRAKNSFWGTRQSSIGNSLSFYNISSLFSPQDSAKEKLLEKDVIIRLMGAVSFGYGLFQLGVSLLPPSLIRLINIFGFTTNRESGIACLMYARLGSDMRAPLAILSLLWYHTIVRPFYAIDGTNVQAGVNAAFLLLKDSEKEFGQASLFQFFLGRANRLNSNIKEARESFQAAASKSEQREMKILCMHEIGWCYLIELEYCKAMDSFIYLKASSRWSRGFYAYLAAICTGSCGNYNTFNYFDDLKEITADIPRAIQLEEFLTRRIHFCPSDSNAAKEKKTIFWRLLVFEMLYLWNALPSCSNENITLIINECEAIDEITDEPMVGISQLIMGSAYCVQKRYNDGITSFRKCLELRQNILPNAEDAHVSAFCQYELSALLVKDPETKAEGKMLLQQMTRFSQYDFEQKLTVRVHNLLKQT